MEENASDPQQLRQAGLSALQSGDALTARRQFERIVARGEADSVVWVALAMACGRLGDAPAMIQAVDQALAIDPRNLHALIMKGDHLAAAGNPRAATQFYGAVVALAAQAPNLPPGLVEAARRAGLARDRINADIEAHLRRQLAAAGYDEAVSSPRFTQSLDLLTGRKQRFVQEPRAYFFPELPQIQFFPRQSFPWLDAVEAATDDIAGELVRVMEQNRGFEPYIQQGQGGPAKGHALLDKLDWSAFFLWKDGAVIRENADRCPRTMAAVDGVPLARIPGRAPMVLFSVLKPGVRIEPHTGFVNTRLICHLPLIVPPGCGLRVGNETRQWERGKALVFDDTIQHEAWNSSDQTRVVLIFDIWRPELSEEERSLVASLMEAVDKYGDAPPATWSG